MRWSMPAGSSAIGSSCQGRSVSGSPGSSMRDWRSRPPQTEQASMSMTVGLVFVNIFMRFHSNLIPAAGYPVSDFGQAFFDADARTPAQLVARSAGVDDVGGILAQPLLHVDG